MTTIDNFAALTIRKEGLVHNDESELNFLRQLISEYSREPAPSAIETPIFIGKLGAGELSFLHKIFPGCSDKDILEISLAMGFNPSRDYIAFMQYTNGCILFDNSLYIYGTKSNASRSLLLQDQTAVSLFEEREHAQATGNIGEVGWATVGSVSGATEKFNIDISEDGPTRLVSEQSTQKLFSSFSLCMKTLIKVISSISDRNGLKDGTGVELQREINAITLNVM